MLQVQPMAHPELLLVQIIAKRTRIASVRKTMPTLVGTRGIVQRWQFWSPEVDAPVDTQTHTDTLPCSTKVVTAGRCVLGDV